MAFAPSPTHENVKNIVRLHTARDRKLTGRFIIEGFRALSTALQAGLTLEKLYCIDQLSDQALMLTRESQVSLVNQATMKKMSAATTPSGLLGIFRIPPTPAPEELTPGLVLANIQDPGNMGTLIRTAAACAVRSIVIIDGADPWGPKTIQASAGTIAQVTIFQWDWQTLIAHKKTLKLYGLIVLGGQQIQDVDSSKALIVVGNEARGLPDEWLEACDGLITLPMPGGTESLNAAVAGSIALYIAFCKKKA